MFTPTVQRPATSESECIQHLEQERWHGEPICPRCGCIRCYRIRTRKIYKCPGCRRTFTIRHGTIFEDSQLPLTTWFKAIYLAKRRISSVDLANRLDVPQKTAWFMLQRIKAVA